MTPILPIGADIPLGPQTAQPPGFEARAERAVHSADVAATATVCGNCRDAAGYCLAGRVRLRQTDGCWPNWCD